MRCLSVALRQIHSMEQLGYTMTYSIAGHSAVDCMTDVGLIGETLCHNLQWCSSDMIIDHGINDESIRQYHFSLSH